MNLEFAVGVLMTEAQFAIPDMTIPMSQLSLAELCRLANFNSDILSVISLRVRVGYSDASLSISCSSMETATTIRLGVPSDAELLSNNNCAIALETESKKLDPGVSLEGVRAVLTDSSLGSFYLVEVEGVAVGQLMITYEWMPESNAFAWWIQSVYVDPQHRRRGYFSQLQEYVRQQAIDSGAVALKLYTARDNVKAKSTYERLGMRNVGEMYELPRIEKFGDHPVI